MSNEVKKTEQVERTSSSKLLRSNNTNDVLAGVLRLLGECKAKRTDEKKQTILNRISKATIQLRTNNSVDTDKVKKCQKLIVANYPHIKDCLKNEKLELNESSNELYELLLSFGTKNSISDLPDFLFPDFVDDEVVETKVVGKKKK